MRRVGLPPVRVGLALLGVAALAAGCSLLHGGSASWPPERYVVIASQQHFGGELLPNG